MRLGVCSRSNDVVEPMIKPQWYVSCNDLAKQSLNAAVDEENKRLDIVPKQYLADWKRYLYLCFPFAILVISNYTIHHGEYSSEIV